MEWEAYQEPFTDGFGLCSPTRWRPEDRGGLLPRRSQAFAGALHALVLKFLHGQVEDAKALCNRRMIFQSGSSRISADLAKARRRKGCPGTFTSQEADALRGDLWALGMRSPCLMARACAYAASAVAWELD